MSRRHRIQQVCQPGNPSVNASALVAWIPDTHTCGATLTMPSMVLSGGPTCGASLSMPSLAMAGVMTAGSSISMPSLAITAGMTTGVDISQLEYHTGEILVPQDVWVSTVALCADSANHNAEDLQISSNVGATKDTYLGWNLSGLPSNSTVVGATLYLHVLTAPGATTTVSSFKITNANETWSETTMTCGSRPPADGGLQQAFVVAPTTGAYEFSLGANWVSRLDERMGATSCTMLLQMGGLLQSTTFESVDQATNGSLGPRLRVRFTVPV